MKKMICLALFLAMTFSSLSALAESEPAPTFEFPGGITWAHTPDEVEALYGESCARNDISDEFFALSRIQVDGAEFFGCESAQTIHMYIDEESYGIVCLYTEQAVPDVGTLAEAITALYGEASAEESRTPNLLLNNLGGENLYTWIPGWETEICIVDTGAGKTPRYAVSFLNVPVSNAFLSRLQEITRG